MSKYFRVLLPVLFYIFVSLLVAGSENIGSKEVAMILEKLDSELEKRNIYLGKRRATIDSLRLAMNAPDMSVESKLETMLRLGDTYNAYNTDSALAIYSKGAAWAKELKLDSVAMRFELRRVTFLPLHALLHQAEEGYDNIEYDKLPLGLHQEYYDAGRQMNFYIASYYVDYPEMYDKYMDRAHEAQDRLISELEEGSPRYMLNKGERFFYRQEYSKAKAILSLLIDRLPSEDNRYARACHMLADISKARGEHHAYVYYLALSAIGDTRGGDS